MNKTKNLRIKWSTWRKLREKFPGVRGETAAQYMDKILYCVLNPEAFEGEK